MECFDVLIVGGATTGSFLARKLAENGYRVLVLEQQPKEKLGCVPEVMRIHEGDFARYRLPMPERTDDFAFSCPGGSIFSALGRFPKRIECTTIGVYRFRYVARLNAWAQEAGAQIRYRATFVDFVYEAGRIAGGVYAQDGVMREVRASLVADCSGAIAAARTKIPAGYGVENTPVVPEFLRYATLRHIVYREPWDYVSCMRGWTYYSIWEAQEGRADCAVLGTWSNGSYDAGERAFAAFQRTVQLPRYTVLRTERRTFPTRYPLFSFVADGFFASGDAAYIIAPATEAGLVICLPQLSIAAEEIGRLLGEGGPLTRARLWRINTRFYAEEGGALAAQYAMQEAFPGTTVKENDFFFRRDVIFSGRTLQSLSRGRKPTISAKEKLRMTLILLCGVPTGQVRAGTIAGLLRCMRNMARAEKLYASYPESENDFDAWVSRAEAFWTRCGKKAEDGNTRTTTRI